MLFSAIELNMFLWMEFLEHLKIATAERNVFVKRPGNMIYWNWIKEYNLKFGEWAFLCDFCLFLFFVLRDFIQPKNCEISN